MGDAHFLLQLQTVRHAEVPVDFPTFQIKLSDKSLPEVVHRVMASRGRWAFVVLINAPWNEATQSKQPTPKPQLCMFE